MLYSDWAIVLLVVGIALAFEDRPGAAAERAPVEKNPNSTTMSNEAPTPQAASVMTLENYRFPAHRLQQQQSDPDRIPLVLVACGSFSPITYLHLRMFEMANDYSRINTKYEVVGGYLSPG